MRTIVVCLPWMACAALSQAETEPFRETVAYRLLASSREFCSSAVSDGGELPEEGYALRMLLARSDAREVFRALVTESRTPAGELYALCGLKSTDPTRFWPLARDRLARRESVTTFEGCSVAASPVGSLVQLIIDSERAELLCGGRPPSSKALRTLGERLADSDAAVRSAAWDEVARLGPYAAELLPKGLRSVDSADWAVALEAVYEVGAWAAPVAVPWLWGELERADRSLQELALAVDYLQECLRVSARVLALPAFAREIHGEEGWVGYEVKRLPPRAVDRLVGALPDSSAACGLGYGGSETLAAVSPLCRHADEGVRSTALGVVIQIANEREDLREAALPVLDAWIRDPSAELRERALQAVRDLELTRAR